MTGADEERRRMAIQEERNRQLARIADALERQNVPKPKTWWDHFKDRL